MSVRVRFAPSPTGYLHIGGLRTALYCYLYAKNQGGKYLLRIEDTDQTRKVDDAVERLIKVMLEMGITHDEGPFLTQDDKIYQKGDCQPYIQSQKLKRYQEVAEELVEKGYAYHCFCSKDRLQKVREEQKNSGLTPKYDGLCRNIDLEEARARIARGDKYVIRLKLPENRDLTFHDHVRGDVTFNTEDLDDQVLIKDDGFPTYHMAVVVDDHDMGITHVMRGEEWLSSTPKHVYLYEALGWEAPEYVHLPLILNSQKKKLSKRHDDVAVEDFLKKGFLKEALINYVALVGWSPADGVEIMSLEEIVEKFSLDRLASSSAVFDIPKLKWLNSQYLMNTDTEKLYELCRPYLLQEGVVALEEYEQKKAWVCHVIESLKSRSETLLELAQKAKLYIDEDFEMEADTVDVMEEETANTVLIALKNYVETLPILNMENSKDILKVVQKETGIKGKSLFMPVRAALSGSLHGVDMVYLLGLLGKEKVISRLERAIK